jgi:predicted alpha/beta-hydrolase family hydrolase
VGIALEIDVGGQCVAGLLERPSDAIACLVLAHGAGAGMHHPFMQSVAIGLAHRRVATLRYQFPYMNAGRRRPDPPALCHQTVIAAVAAARARLPELALFAGGKSFGGRMTTQCQADSPLPAVQGLVLLGFPLHPAKRPATSRGAHLSRVKIPLLFLQGTRDALADISLMKPLAAGLGRAVTLVEVEGADHSFHVPARSGRKDDEVLSASLDGIADWIAKTSS